MANRKWFGLLGASLATTTLVGLATAGTASAAEQAQAAPHAASQLKASQCTYTAQFNGDGVRVYAGTASSGPDTSRVIGLGYRGQSVTYHTSNSSGLYHFITYIGDDGKSRDGWVVWENLNVTPHCPN